jgi:hypothetical protein
MRHAASILLTLSCALWLGLLVSLFLFAPAIFEAFGPDRTLAGKATSAMFVRFSQFQLLLAAAALIGAFLAYLEGRRPINIALFTLLAIACVGAAAYKMYFIPRMEELRTAALTTTPEWRKLHGLSMMVSTAIGLLVLAATLVGTYVQRDLFTKVEPTTTGYGTIPP